MLPLIFCSIIWIVALLPALATLFSTISVAAGRKMQGQTGPSYLYIAHLSFFVAVLVGVGGAWLLAALGFWSAAYIFLTLPLFSLMWFALLLMNMSKL